MALTPEQEVIRNKVQDGLRAAVLKAGGTPPPIVEAKVADWFNKDTDNAGKEEGKKSYSEIVGEAHPSGNEYYFTTYQPEDWDEDLRHLIPEVDKNYIPNHDVFLAVLMGIEFDKSVVLTGPPGTGKSTGPQQVCALIGYPFLKISGMGGTEPADYIGSPWVNEGSMEFKWAKGGLAIKRGIYLIFDEYAKNSAQTNMCFQSVMDSSRTLDVHGHPDPLQSSLKAHPKFRICLTDNVRGFGDDMGKYAAEVQDQSTINRCTYKIHVGYTSQTEEKALLSNRFPEATDKLLQAVTSLAGLLRSAWDKDEGVSAPFSIRDTQELVEGALFFKDIGLAFKQNYYGAITDPQEQKAVRDIFRTAFGTSVSL